VIKEVCASDDYSTIIRCTETFLIALYVTTVECRRKKK